MNDINVKTERIMPVLNYLGVIGFIADKSSNNIEVNLPSKVFDEYFPGGGDCREFMQIGLMTVTVMRKKDQ